MSPRRRRWLARGAMILAGVLLGGALAEGSVRARGLGWRTVNRSLYWQGSDLEVYRYSDDPFLHYELDPGASKEGTGPWGNRFAITVDEYGARGPAHAAGTSAETFRILLFGGSTMFGAGVDDSETIPAVLERLLADPAALGAAEGDYEAWNFGNSGYVAAQAIRLARNSLATLDQVDLIVIVPTNNGRRPFLGGPDAMERDHRWFFWHDPSAYLENYPPPARVPAGIHRGLLRHSELYRYVIARQRLRMPNNPAGQEHIAAINLAEVRALWAEADSRDTKVVFAYYPRSGRAAPPNMGFVVPLGGFVDLQRADRPDAFYEVHPPPEYLAQHAATLAEELLAAGYLPSAPSPGATP